MKKYELTNETIKYASKKLFRIRALKDFGCVKAGDLGGYVESENNLSQENNCWIDNNASVYGDAVVSGNAWVFDDAEVYGNARVYENAEVYGEARVFDNAEVFGKAWVYENASVLGDAKVYGDAVVSGNAKEITGEKKMKIKKELNSRQWALYEHLKYLYMLNDSEWRNLKDLCNALKSFKEYHYKETANFNNTSARRILTHDLNRLANSDIIQKVVLCTSKGIKIANSEEIEIELSKQKISILKQIKRLNKQYKKSVLNGQYRLVFGKEKEIIEVF